MTQQAPTSRTERFDLTAMLPGPQHCTSCAERVCAAAGELTGVIAARCDGEAGEVEVTYDPSVLSSDAVRLALEERARVETDAVGHAAYRLEGLD